MHPSALASRGNDAGTTKVSQMPGDFRLAHAEYAHKVADADFLVGDEVQQTKPRGIGESAKEKVEWK